MSSSTAWSTGLRPRGGADGVSQSWPDALDRGSDVGPQPRRVVVARVERHPHEPGILSGAPGTDRGRLPVPCGRLEHGETDLSAVVEELGESSSIDHVAANARRRELRLDEGCRVVMPVVRHSPPPDRPTGVLACAAPPSRVQNATGITPFGWFPCARWLGVGSAGTPARRAIVRPAPHTGRVARGRRGASTSRRQELRPGWGPPDRSRWSWPPARCRSVPGPSTDTRAPG